MDFEPRAVVDDSDRAIREREDKQQMQDDGMLHITIELTIDGQCVHRNFRTEDVAHIDWNPQINDMADTIAKSKEPL